MWDLFKSEAMRFRGWTAGVAVVHLATLTFLSSMEDLAQQRLFVHVAFGAIYAVLGALLGLYQMSAYRKPSHWLNLLHRPLPRVRIAIALIAAGAVQLVVVVALPLLVTAISQEATTARVLDLRHWLLLVSSLLVAWCAYLAGALCRLRGTRYAVAALPLLWWLPASNASGFGILGVELLALLWLGALLLDTFRPDLSAPPRGPGAILVALPLMSGVYVLILVLFLGFEMIWIAQGSHPNNTATPPKGGHNELEHAEPRVRLLAGLEGSSHPDARSLRGQVERSEPGSMPLPPAVLPRRQELSNARLAEFNDEKRNERWVFSHDDMRLHGHRLTDGSARGAIGVGEPHAPFPAVVAPLWARAGMAGGDPLLSAGDTVYQLAFQTRQVIPRLRVASGEAVAAASRVGRSIGVLSDQGVYFYRAQFLSEGHELLTPRMRLALPGKVGDLRNLDLVELDDGYLAAFLFSARSSGPRGATPIQILMRAHDDGRIETLDRRDLRFDYPVLSRYRAWWISPAMYAVRERALELFATARPLASTAPAPVPFSMWSFAAMLALLSVPAAVWRTAGVSLSRPARFAWIAACGVVGLPGLAALWLMLPPRAHRLIIRRQAISASATRTPTG